jgi:hypothetical protein
MHASDDMQHGGRDSCDIDRGGIRGKLSSHLIVYLPPISRGKFSLAGEIADANL